MTLEERIQQIIGSQVVAICNLQAQLEQAQAELAELNKVKANGGMAHDNNDAKDDA